MIITFTPILFLSIKDLDLFPGQPIQLKDPPINISLRRVLTYSATNLKSNSLNLVVLYRT
jgi:hypothetical protein